MDEATGQAQTATPLSPDSPASAVVLAYLRQVASIRTRLDDLVARESGTHS